MVVTCCINVFLRRLVRQAQQGWGAKVIERPAHDLRTASPQMKGLSPRNLKSMRAFAEAWPDAEFVQQAVAQLPWGHNLVLRDRLNTPSERRGYAAKATEHNGSRHVLNIQIETRPGGHPTYVHRKARNPHDLP